MAIGISKASLHVTQPGNLNGLGDWLHDTSDAGQAAPVVYAVNGNLKNTLFNNSPSSKLIYRRQTDTFNRLPNNFYNDDPVASATNWITQTRDSADQNRTLLQNWMLNPADWYDPLNEPVIQLPPNYTQAQLQEETRKAQYLNTWMVTALNIAKANNIRLALFSFPTGSPSMELWPNLYPALRQGAAQGAVLSLHEYSISGSMQHSEAGNVLRYRDVYASLPADCRLPIVVSECGAGNGYDTGLSGQAWVNDLMWYNAQTCQDDYLLAFCAYQLGGNESNLTSTLPAYAVAIEGFDCAMTPPPDPVDNESISGDFAANAMLIDNYGHVWTLGHDRIEPGYAVLKDGQQFGGGWGTALLYLDEHVYVTNDMGEWYQITDGGYQAIFDDPRVYSPPIPPDPTPDPGPFWVAWPVKSSEAIRITDHFNAPRSYANGKHEGMDCDAYDNSTGRNAEIVAAQDGIVEYVLNRSGTGYGQHVVIRHPWGSEASRYRTLYAHMSSITVTVGQSVKLGDKIGIAGATGTSAIHLHFNVHDAVSGLKGYVRESDCSSNWPDGVIDPETVLRTSTPPPNPNPAGSAIFGVHCRANGGDLPAIEQDAANKVHVNVKGYKFLTGASQSHYNTILNGLHYDPSKCMTRLFWDASGVSAMPTPAQFIDWMRAGIQDAWNVGIRAFELLNEVNLYNEWKSTWGGAAGFCDWALQVISQLRSMWSGIQIVSPGLAPIGDLAGIGENTDKWINTFNSKGLFSACNYAGAHAYFGNRAGMTTTADGLNFRRYYTATVKNIWITEFANNQSVDNDTEKGKQYKDYIAYLRANDPRVERAYLYVMSSTTQGENDTRQTLVRGNAITAIVTELSK